MTPENLGRLGALRLGEILVALAATRPDLKRRLRLELAADQGADQLLPEVDRRLASLARSQGRISWRRRPAVVADLDGLRDLIAHRLDALDPPASLSRLWAFLALAAPIGRRLTDRDGALGAVFDRAAAALLARLRPVDAATLAAAAVQAVPTAWAGWLVRGDADLSPAVAAAALADLPAAEAGAALAPVRRRLADRAGDAAAFAASFTPGDRRRPAVAADITRRWLVAGDIANAAAALASGAPRGSAALEPAWAAAQIDLLEAEGRGDAAQGARWALFAETLAPEPLREQLRRLADFDDVDAETRALALTAAHPDADRALAFLVGWPALSAAAALVARRAEALDPAPDTALLWAGRMAARHPGAAERLLRAAAARAFRRRAYAVSTRLTQEADAIAPASGG